jgi:hypothetical protein
VSVRRYVNLTRADLAALLQHGATPTDQECLLEVRRGAPFRIQADTVARESALRAYALRAQATRLDGVPTIGMDVALKNLADAQIPRVRIAAVSGTHNYVLFLDPEATYLIGCLGVESPFGSQA